MVLKFGIALCFVLGIVSVCTIPQIKELIIPYPKDCNFFYKLIKCPDGLIYNKKLQVCDWPRNTVCETDGQINFGSESNNGESSSESTPVGESNSNKGQCGSHGKGDNLGNEGSGCVNKECQCNRAGSGADKKGYRSSSSSCNSQKKHGTKCGCRNGAGLSYNEKGSLEGDDSNNAGQCNPENRHHSSTNIKCNRIQLDSCECGDNNEEYGSSNSECGTDVGNSAPCRGGSHCNNQGSPREACKSGNKARNNGYKQDSTNCNSKTGAVRPECGCYISSNERCGLGNGGCVLSNKDFECGDKKCNTINKDCKSNCNGDRKESSKIDFHCGCKGSCGNAPDSVGNNHNSGGSNSVSGSCGSNPIGSGTESKGSESSSEAGCNSCSERCGSNCGGDVSGCTTSTNVGTESSSVPSSGGNESETKGNETGSEGISFGCEGSGAGSNMVTESTGSGTGFIGHGSGIEGSQTGFTDSGLAPGGSELGSGENCTSSVGHTSYCEDGLESSQKCLPTSKCPRVDDAKLPYRDNCSLYCHCDAGVAKTCICPPGLHFSVEVKRCVDPLTAQCEIECPILQKGEGTHWSPARCTETSSKKGDLCHISCDRGYELKGSDKIECTHNGWNGTGGFNKIPSCKTSEGVGNHLVEKLMEAGADREVGLLFILDESGSVGSPQFAMETSFVKAIVTAFPLSENRSAGVITFSNGANVDISIDHKDTCEFLKLTDLIKYSGGGTDIHRALSLANMHIANHAVHNVTLIMLITDGASSTDPTPEAEIAKSNGNVLFTVGVGRYDRQQLEPISSLDSGGAPLFYGITDFRAFNNIVEYLHRAFGSGEVQCPNGKRRS